MTPQVGDRVLIWPSAVDVCEATLTEMLDYDQVKVAWKAGDMVIDSELVFPLSDEGRRKLAKSLREDAGWMQRKAAELMDAIEPVGDRGRK